MSRAYRPMGKQVDDVFARETQMDAEAEERARRIKERETELAEELIKSPYFREWFTGIQLKYSGEVLTGPVNEIRQGQLLMLAELKRSLSMAKGAPRFFAGITERFWAAVRPASDGAADAEASEDDK